MWLSSIHSAHNVIQAQVKDMGVLVKLDVLYSVNLCLVEKPKDLFDVPELSIVFLQTLIGLSSQSHALTHTFHHVV